ncbi:PH (Pleckstrin Homology) domain-containing protein [Tumebacillus sp. BK434]|uniref:PH domain-containing protein n=1 Tax=Tumebacillus sp. BK434 TaxID=2512169 RepID=UPI0010D48A26|nr:PH domain-containing protein [Tumebacillus sp. BK434]TCP57663.1 PH (Pleckstrin Homology) domain-containing protein [Tumebacillus sp. BK434]
MILVVLLADDMTWFTIAFLLACAGGLLYNGLYRPPRQFVRYELGRYELVIHSDKGKWLLPYEKVKAITVQSFLEKPFAIEGEIYRGYAYGLFRLGSYEAALYATRRDRLVLLDTEDGLIGLTPAAEVEDAFVAELAAKSNAMRVPDGFAVSKGRGYVPAHAKKSPAIWPIVLFGFLLNLVIAKFEDAFVFSGSFWFDAGSIALVVVAVLLYRPLLRLHRLQPWLFPVLSAILTLMMFAI